MAVGDEQITFDINNPTNAPMDQVQAHEIELSKLLLDNPDEGPDPETHTDDPEPHANEVPKPHISRMLEQEEYET